MPEATVAVLLADASRKLAPVTDSARLDGEVLLAAAMGKPRSHLYAWPEQQPARHVVETFETLVDGRLRGKPIAYLVGRKEFWSLPLKVTADTLIPRPETELLVELALLCIPRHGRPTVLDLGTGSGAVALALASERPSATVLAVDSSARALAIAQENAAYLQSENIDLVVSNWFSAIATTLRADAIVANPPYVAEGDPHLLRGDPRFEPRTALVAGKDGLRDLTAIIAAAPAYLKAGGTLLLEHGYDQGRKVRHLMSKHGLQHIATARDASGLERITRGAREY